MFETDQENECLCYERDNFILEELQLASDADQAWLNLGYFL